MFGLFSFLRFKFKGRRMLSALCNSLIIASIASILFGFVFGEFFGATVIKPLLHRAEDVNTMLLVSVIVGIVHLNLGFLFGFLNVLRYHGAKAAVLEKGSWMLLEVGAALIAADSLKMVAIGMYPGAAVILAAIVMLYKGHGIGGIIELPAIFSNILSYARLFAVGLASVSLALVINRFATDFFASGGVYAVLGVLTLVFGHVVNLMLGILGCFLHSMRLHYVEFFSKFYEGGGEPYSPFG
jgi:V/A-type H+-transporting ATPase subunit I